MPPNFYLRRWATNQIWLEIYFSIKTDLHVLHALWKHWFQLLQKNLDLIYLTNMNHLISTFCCCLLKKTLVITTTNLTNPESASSIICLTKSTCIAIKLSVQLSLRVQKKNWDKWNMIICNVCVFGSFSLFALCIISISISIKVLYTLRQKHNEM